MKAWLMLVIAGLLEVCWASSLKATAGFTRLWPSVFFGVSLAGSIFLLSFAVRTLPVGTAYAIGAAGTVIVSVVLYGETMGIGKSLFLGLLIVSVVGLKLTSGADSNP